MASSTRVEGPARRPTGYSDDVMHWLEGACGGELACSTCHIILEEAYFDKLEEADEEEEDMLDLAPGLEPQSRLACQCVPDGSQDIIVEIPEWNRNLVSETH